MVIGAIKTSPLSPQEKAGLQIKGATPVAGEGDVKNSLGESNQVTTLLCFLLSL